MENNLQVTVEAKEYWMNNLKDCSSKTIIPYSMVRNIDLPKIFETVHFDFDEELVERIKHISNNSDNRLFMVLLSGLMVLLKKYNQDNDVKIGIPIYDQSSEEKFINTILTIRSELGDETKFKEVILKIRELLIQADLHQNYPIEKILYNLGYSSDNKDIPFFDVVALLDTLHNEVYIEKYENNIVFKFKNGDEKIGVDIIFNANVYSSEYVNLIAENYVFLMKNVLDNLDLVLTDIQIIHPKQKSLILEGFNNTVSSANQEKDIRIELNNVCDRYADHSAVIDAVGNEITYKQLKAEYLFLSHRLVNKYGVKAGDRIGVHIKDSKEWVITFLAVIHIGAVYVPINPSYPKERIDYMLNDSHLSLFISNSDVQFQEIVKEINILKELASIDENEHSVVSPNSDLNAPAYLIYTSGSTGNPKGVLMPFRSLNNLINWQMYDTSIQNELKTLQFASISFDVSLQETFFTLLTGGTLFLINDDLRQDITELEKHIGQKNIELLFLPYSVLNVLFKLGSELIHNKEIKHIVTAGEALILTDNLMSFLKNNSQIVIHNQYGPSETHVVTSFSFSYDNLNTLQFPPIGKPISNTAIYILNNKKEILPIGVEGEIYISGDQVGLGYLHSMDSTNKFVPNIFHQNKLFYRTGDIGKWNENGNIEFIKRIDDQVKIRGFRVELEEVRKNLLKHPNVKDCVVMAQESHLGEQKELVTYIVCQNIETVDLSDVRTFLNQKLPYYMVPSDFIVVENFPININGKVDKKALSNMSTLIKKKSTPPVNKIQEELVNLWTEVLNRDNFGIDDEIIELGGNSISIVIIISKIKLKFDVSISMKDIFSLKTIRKISQKIEENSLEVELLIHLNESIDQQKNVFFIPPIIGSSTIFQDLAEKIQNKNCLGLQYKGFDNEIPFDNGINEIAQTFVSEIVNYQKTGNYTLVGFSMGAIVAFEMTKLLEEKGEEVNLILIDKNLNVDYEEEEKFFDIDFEEIIRTLQYDASMYRDAQTRIHNLYKHNFKILSEYAVEGQIKAPIYALEARDNNVSTKMEIWENYTQGNFEHLFISGSHFTLLNEDKMADLIHFFNSKI